MDQSGSPRWLFTGDPWQASTIHTVATCKIPAACSSAWEAHTGVEEAADATAVCQSPKCPPLAITGSSRCEDPEDPGIPRSAPARGHRREAGFAIALEKAKRQAQVPPLEKQILATEKYLAKSEGTPLATRCHHCRSQRGVAESRTRQGSRCARCRRRRRSLEKVEDTSCRRSDVADVATCGSCWRSDPSPANGCGIATAVAATWCSGGPTAGCSCGPIINFSTSDSEEGGLCSSDGARGVGVDGRPS